jgi:hypothetical protein
MRSGAASARSSSPADSYPSLTFITCKRSLAGPGAGR